MSREITLTLPNDLAEQAEPLGLLRPEAVERLIREEVRRRAWDRLIETARRIHAANIPPMTEDEVQAEVDAARAERRARRAGGA
jgi:hypothetical protein